MVALARELLGGNGIIYDHIVARHFLDMEAAYTYEGTYEVNTLYVPSSFSISFSLGSDLTIVFIKGVRKGDYRDSGLQGGPEVASPEVGHQGALFSILVLG